MPIPTESAHAGSLATALLEVMGSLMEPRRAETLLSRSLVAFGWASVPEDPESVRALVEGPLRTLLAEELGFEAATFVLEDLAPILELASSGVRATRSEVRISEMPSTKPAPPYDQGKLGIAAATLGSLEELKRQIGPFAQVMRVRDAFELFSLIEGRRGPLLVVIDGYRRAVDLSTLSTLMPRISDGCRVILWGFDGPSADRFLTMDRWSSIDASSDWIELAAALRDIS